MCVRRMLQEVTQAQLLRAFSNYVCATYLHTTMSLDTHILTELKPHNY